MLFTISCNNGQSKNQSENHTQNSKKDQELLKKLDGEWAVSKDWNDSILTFNNKTDKDFEQEIFPSYDTIIFNPKNKTIEVNTYGEFGCGQGAIENLEITNSKWSFENELLRLTFDYSNYSGQHKLEDLYSIERNGEQLILRKVK